MFTCGWETGFRESEHGSPSIVKLARPGWWVSHDPAFLNDHKCWEIIRAVSAVVRHEPVGLRGLIRIGALPIRRFPVSRLCLRQARDLWVLNRNELKIKGLVDGESRERSDVRLGV